MKNTKYDVWGDESVSKKEKKFIQEMRFLALKMVFSTCSPKTKMVIEGRKQNICECVFEYLERRAAELGVNLLDDGLGTPASQHGGVPGASQIERGRSEERSAAQQIRNEVCYACAEADCLRVTRSSRLSRILLLRQ